MAQPAKETPLPRSGAPRWMRLVLVVSLALNLLVIGAVAGAAITGGGPWRGMEAHGGPMARALTPEDRRILRQRSLEARGDLRDGRRAHRAAMQELVTLLRATPFDAEAVEAQMRVVRVMLGERMAQGQSLLLDRLSDMTPAERAAYADRLAEALRNGPGPRR